jgi:prolipoprotein diacylglyceryltransferase
VAGVSTDEIVREMWLLVASRALTEWGLFQLLAAVAATVWLSLRAPPELRQLRVCLVAALPIALLGALLLEPLLRAPAWLLAGGPGAPPAPRGIAAYGALAGLIGGYAALSRLRGVRVGAALDLLAPSLGVLVFFARVGCFRAGCDFGAPTSLPWAVDYAPLTPAFARHRDAGLIAADAAQSLGVHPTQLYEAGLGLLMAAVALWVTRMQKRSAAAPGWAFASVALVYAIGRALIELVRGDVERTGPTPTNAQWLGAMVVALVILWTTRATSPVTDRMRPRRHCS